MPTPGPLELVIILVIALVILGPGKLPDVGAALGKSIREFRKASSDVQDAVTVNVDTSPLPASPAPRRSRPGRAGRTGGRRGRRRSPTRARRSGRSLGRAGAGHDADRRLAERHQLAGRRSTRPWPTPTPCSSRRHRAPAAPDPSLPRRPPPPRRREGR